MSYSMDQLLTTLPAGTPITFHGKTLTLASIRAMRHALLARFRSAGSLTSLLTFEPLVAAPVRGLVTHSIALDTPAGKASSSPTSTPMKHMAPGNTEANDSPVVLTHGSYERKTAERRDLRQPRRRDVLTSKTRARIGVVLPSIA
jgi:hypothetical protein